MVVEALAVAPLVLAALVAVERERQTTRLLRLAPLTRAAAEEAAAMPLVAVLSAALAVPA